MKFLTMFLLASVSLLAHEYNCPELSLAQKWVGYLSWVGFLKFIAISGISGGIIFVFSGLLKRVLDFTKQILEGLLWLLSISGMIGAYFIPIEYSWLREYVLIISSFLFPAAMITSALLRNWEKDEKTFFRVVTIVWGIVSIFYINEILGFFAIVALFSALGFSMGVSPFTHYFGFDDGDSMGRVLIVGSIMIFIYIAYKIFGFDIEYLNIFEAGFLWIGSFASGIALLITSSKWYGNKNIYITMNLITIIFFVGGVSIGLLFGIKPLNTMALTLLLFYISEKIIEIKPESKIGIGVVMIIIGSMFGWVWYYMSNNQELVLKYLTISI